jgi:AcrR family transcriptional regulator
MSRAGSRNKNSNASNLARARHPRRDQRSARHTRVSARLEAAGTLPSPKKAHGARANPSARAPGSAEGSQTAVRKVPRQQRSKELVEAILRAAAEVFAEQGYARATTNRVAERAGVSVGSLYQYFPNKDSLLASLLARHHAEVEQVVGAALVRLGDSTIPLEDGLRQLVRELVAVHGADPALTRALSSAVLRQSSVTDGHDHGEPMEQARRVASILAARPDVRAGDHEAMALVVSEATGHLTRWLVHDPPPVASREALSEEVLHLLVHYLQRP